MPTEFYSDIARIAEDVTSGTGPMRGKGGNVSASVCVATATVTINGTEAVNDVINLVRLKKGAVVLPHLCRVVGAATGTALSVKIGTDKTGEEAAYSTALDIKAAHDVGFTGGTKAPVIEDEPYWVTATVTAASAPTAGATTTFLIVYRFLG